MPPNGLWADSKHTSSSNLTRIAGMSFKTTGRQHQSTTTSRHIQLELDLLMPSPPVSLAKTSVKLESKPVYKAQEVGCFTKSCVWLGKFNPALSSWRTWETFYLTPTGRHSKKSSAKLPRQGLMLSGHVYQLQIWEPATKENEFGSLPTPRSCSAMAAAVDTPGNLENKRYPNLETVIGRLLPTPAATDWKGRSGEGHIQRHGYKRVSDALIPTGGGLYLNPSFVEEMMGFPIGWTA